MLGGNRLEEKKWVINRIKKMEPQKKVTIKVDNSKRLYQPKVSKRKLST